MQANAPETILLRFYYAFDEHAIVHMGNKGNLIAFNLLLAFLIYRSVTQFELLKAFRMDKFYECDKLMNRQFHTKKAKAIARSSSE